MQDAGICTDCQVNIVAGPRSTSSARRRRCSRSSRASRPCAVPALRARSVRHRPASGMGGHPPEGDGRTEPHPRQQRRDAEPTSPTPGPRRRVVPLDGHREITGHGGRTVSVTSSARRRRARARHPLATVIDGAAGVAPGRRVKAVFSGVSNRVVTGSSSTCRQLRGLLRHRQWHGRRRLHRLRRQRLHGRGRPHVLPLPLRRVVRTVPPVQARLRRDHHTARRPGGGVGGETTVPSIQGG